MPARLPSKLLTCALLAAFLGVALYLRIAFPYAQVFNGQEIKLSGSDAYYHFRIVENLVRNFPYLNGFDPYLRFPSDIGLGNVHFFDWLLAGVIRLFNPAGATEQAVYTFAAYFPAVLAALTVVPMFFLGKALFNRWAGLIAASLIAILPGEWLGRSILGFTDHHVAEVLFTTTMMLFLVLALKDARENRIRLASLRDPRTLRMTLLYAALAGLFLGLYMLTWTGALLFVFVITLYFVAQAIIDHVKGRPLGYLGLIGPTLFLTAMIVTLPLLHDPMTVAALLAALIVPAALVAVSAFMSRKQVRAAYYPLSLLGILVIGLGLVRVASPSFLDAALALFGIFAPQGASLTTMEMRPILFPDGQFSVSIVWATFSTSLLLAPVAFGVICASLLKPENSGRNLLLVWTLVIVAATLAQRRFAYYMAVNVALLTGFALAAAVGWVAAIRATRAPAQSKAKRSGAPQAARPRRVLPWQTAVGIVALILVLIHYPWNVYASVNIARSQHFGPTGAWYQALTWMRTNTPEPLGSADAYYARYPEPYKYPDSAYAVTSWWDYGYWITGIGHRMASTNPSQAAEPIKDVSNLLLAQDEASAATIMKRLHSSYVIVDDTMPSSTHKLSAIITWAGQQQSEFWEDYFIPDKDNPTWVRLYYPEYFRSMVVRLYNFDGQAAAASNPLVISYEDRTTSDGQPYKRITGFTPYTDYKTASQFMAGQKSGKYRLVSDDPFQSPVPLEPVSSYRMVYAPYTEQGIPEVKVFQHAPRM